MSFVEYSNLLYQISEEIDWETKRGRLMFIINRSLPDDSGDDITDVISLLTKMEEKNLLGIDRLGVLKDLLKGIEKFDLKRKVEKFEIQRKDYKQLLEQIGRALDESNELQQLISICRRQNLITHERERDGNIINVNALFTELEQHNNLGIEILKTMINELKKPDLCRLIEDFERKRKQEEDAERDKKEWEDCKRKRRGKKHFLTKRFFSETFLKFYNQSFTTYNRRQSVESSVTAY